MMALFDKNKSSLVAEVNELRQQGLTDDFITTELSKKGYPPQQVSEALANMDLPEESSYPPEMPPMEDMNLTSETRSTSPYAAPAEEIGNVYERIEEITESMIDEKWDDLIVEVKKIVEWKEQIEDKQIKIMSDLAKLKEDFKILHQGVLGKLEDYDTRMRDVGTELKAVGKVFKDVIPTFVENVKELKEINKSRK